LWSATHLVSLSLAQTGSDPGMRLRGDLPKWRASSLDWCANPSSSRDRGANPPGDRRECGRPPTCSELACCGGRRPRVAIDGSNRGRRPPRVAIAGSTPPRVVIVVPARGSTSSSCRSRERRPHRVVIVVSIQRIRSLIVVSIQRIRSLLESLSWCQPLLES